jgi:hypothetical protein
MAGLDRFHRIQPGFLFSFALWRQTLDLQQRQAFDVTLLPVP